MSRQLVGVRIAGVVIVSLLLWARGATAQVAPDDLARKHFESGVAYLQESDLDNALKAFEKAYELSSRPEILLNIATVHERLSDAPAAIAALREFVEVAPDSPHAQTARLRIDNLAERVDESEPLAEPQPPGEGPEAATGTAPAGSAPEAAKPPSAVPPAPRASESVARHDPGFPRWPAYASFGVGGLAAIGAVATGLVAKNEYDTADQGCSPGCSDDQLARGRNMALASTVLTIVAVAGGGAGTALWFMADDGSPRETGALPRWRFTAASNGAQASATWRY